jgi:hypothetical protein
VDPNSGAPRAILSNDPLRWRVLGIVRSPGLRDRRDGWSLQQQIIRRRSAKLTRQLFGQHLERTVQLLDQMELALEELESSATEDKIAAERAVAKTTNVVAFTPQRPGCGLVPFCVQVRGSSSPSRDTRGRGDR